MDLSNFDPNGPASIHNNIFGLPATEEDATVVLLPVPWEVTVSYHTGTSRAPEHIYKASQQIDLLDPDVPHGWKQGFFMCDIDKDILMRSDYLRKEASLYISFQQEDGKLEENEFMQNGLHEINKGCEDLNEWVYKHTRSLLTKNKLVGLVGGDHSTPLGYYKALAEKYPEYGILQIDAHLDLRENYEDFKYSHASIMYNMLEEVPEVKKLVSVGVRDYCEEEQNRVKTLAGRISVFFDKDMKEKLCEGVSWKVICEDIVARLPQQVYLSLDIDGLDPKLCPHTGTPVQGGLESWQLDYLLKKVVESGRKLIGFDLVEVGYMQDDWDANVGARILFKLCNLMVKDKVLPS